MDRKAELAELEAAFAGGARSVALSGSRGVGKLRPEDEIVVRTREMPPDTPLGIDEDRGRGAAQHLRPHRPRERIPIEARGIDADREAQPELVHERAEGMRLHRFVMLEHGVQPHDDQRLVGERLSDPLRLGQTVRDPGRSIWTGHAEVAGLTSTW